jgi:hypothetical protein
MPTEQQTRRKHHAPQPGSKRSQRRRRAIDRAAYFDDKQALVLGAPVVTFAGARAVVMRAAFGRGSDGRLPDPGLTGDRVDVAIQRFVGKRVQAEYAQQLHDCVQEACGTAFGLQDARELMREVRTLRKTAGLSMMMNPVDSRRVAVSLKSRRIRAILEDLGRTVPREFRVD